MTTEDFDATKAPLIEHLIELRTRLLYSLLGVGTAFVICIFFAKDIYNLLVIPYQWAAGTDAPIEMIYTAPQEFFFTQLRLALFGAVFFAFPVIASQIYMFAAPGLYKNEREAFLPYLIATPVLFVLGALLVYFVVMPLAMTFFLSMQQTDGTAHIKLTARVSEYLTLIMALILGFGDLAASLGFRVGHASGDDAYPGDPWHAARARMIAACRANGLDPIDGPFANFTKPEAYRREASWASTLGAVGKWCIHPSQIAIANDVFAPSEKEIAFARAQIEAYEAATQKGEGSGSAGGMLVDAASLRLFQAVIDRARQTGRID